MQYTVVAVDYFTNWVEEEALAPITPTKIKEFIYKNNICWYEVPHTIVSDNGTQFDCNEFKEFYDDLQSRTTSSQWVSRSCEQDNQAQPKDEARKPKRKVGRRSPRSTLGLKDHRQIDNWRNTVLTSIQI